MIKIEKVNKYFNHRKKNQIHIINNTSLELGDKGLVAILGQSGSGKTTLLNVIGGLDKVNSGKIFINNQKITRRNMNKIDKIRNLNIGYIFQDYKLIENMSVFDNVAISLRMIGIKNKQEIEKRVNYVLNAVNMYRYKNRPAKMLSGGEKQRVAIARAIVKNPSIILADEPTGNLDSKNSIEIMNIIKAISKDKLVILVTHEVELAKFYATRVIEIKDGKIEKDYENNSEDSLEYRVENKIYLKDFKKIKNLKDDNLNIDIYSDEEKTIDVKLVVKNGNIYVQAQNYKVDAIDQNSSIELINDHYKKIDKSIYEECNYNINEVSDKNYKVKYSSIYGMVKSIKQGFTRISNYTTLKKFLLIGFFASGMFITYSLCSIAGSTDIRESDYMKVDRNYLQVSGISISVDDFLKYEKLDQVDYIIPGDGIVSFNLKMDDYYQLSSYAFQVQGSMVDISKINEANIIKGRMPQNEYEILLDKQIVTNLLDNRFSSIKAMGIKTADELLGKAVTISGMDDFTIVGIVDKTSASIYVNKSQFVNILNNMNKNDETMQMFGVISTDEDKTSQTTVKDYNLYLDDIKLTKGRMPENDYEVIVNSANQGEMKLNKPIDVKINDKQLTVVGYYESKTNRQDYLVNNNTVKYSVILENEGMMIYPKNKELAKTELESNYGLNVIDRYNYDKDKYIKDKQDSIRSSVIFAGIILIISLIEIYLMIRSSFLSRIKEVGVLRAIGIKRKDIYRMFIGEIISITTITSLPGIALMTYILYQISKISYVSRMFVVNINTIGLSIILVYLFNILVGLLPVFRVVRKTPAQILARHDVE